MISILSPEVRMDEMAAIVPINGRSFQIGEGGKRRRKIDGTTFAQSDVIISLRDLSMVVSMSRFFVHIRTQRRATRINLSTNATIQGKNKISNMTRYTKND